MNAVGVVRVRVALPGHLRTLARVDGAGAAASHRGSGWSSEVGVDVPPPVTLERVLDALEAAWPTLAGTVRDPVTGQRRPMVRVYVAEEDRSHHPLDVPLPAAVVRGEVPVRIVGAMAGG